MTYLRYYGSNNHALKFTLLNEYLYKVIYQQNSTYFIFIYLMYIKLLTLQNKMSYHALMVICFYFVIFHTLHLFQLSIGLIQD